ncbi:tRNA (guanosine(46)-N7)-methyltransferase TrmB [Mycobacterium sp. 852002-53434_SCH5985345]|uniref:tRNA (guanosine(46)-N7)-methyltransferase TrmB n=1 Tax=unclassified Mycobacterium TaxID=2642494 RepID=UPI0007FC4BFA|nr:MULTISPECIES: tRNA (guanosine(46)-N7)-methyltransferase TrmB [unclassified Mycobacterium]OBF59685.1 tRNA (guanosine(46)-N7)-methyltransferase TrmB [Mycobacterium sp. 852002-53434_SCH5985345]OBF72438.1 tRNA (guanosine(46)-N7)-methyltransferase TrmB [Mycobacterium sp. 852002-51613_SCH5001154]
MGHHGQMHAQPRAGAFPDAPEEESDDRRGQRYLPASSFRSRRSALSDAQRQTWERLWPELGLSLDAPGEGGGDPRLDTRAWFGRQAPLVLEIGCGSGISTLAMAKDEPDVDVIAVEIYKRGLAQLLCAIDRDGVGNIRLIRGNGVEVLQRLIPSGSLTGVRVFFPDPWPKARHHKRRFLQPGTVGLIADRLLPGGVLHAATDHPGYAEHIGAVGDAEPRLRRADAGSRLPISVARPTTKYETKAHEAGSAVTEFIWLRHE